MDKLLQSVLPGARTQLMMLPKEQSPRPVLLGARVRKCICPQLGALIDGKIYKVANEISPRAT